MSNKNKDTSLIKEKVRAYIKDASHADIQNMEDESYIFRQGFLDSMGFITMITFIEEEFMVKTSDEDLVEENFESINAITDFISRKLQSTICAD
jgi:acyl carrier protein